MDGIFVRKKVRFWLILLLVVALFAARYLLRHIASPETAGKPTALIVYGVVLCLFGIPAVLMNHGAYLHIDTETNRMKAKYRWFGRIDCSLEDIAFVHPQINTLTILMKDGKRHVIGFLENSADLSAAIRRQTFSLERESPEKLRQELLSLQMRKKKALWWVLGGSVLLFVYIGLAVCLTGGKELHQFNGRDWVVFGLMCAMELVTMVATICVADRCGKYQLPMAQLQYRIRSAVIATQPLPSNQVLEVYVDVNCRKRVLVCGFPKDKSVYCDVQRFNGDMVLETAESSKVYNSTEALKEDCVWMKETEVEMAFDLIDISDLVLTR